MSVMVYVTTKNRCSFIKFDPLFEFVILAIDWLPSSIVSLPFFMPSSVSVTVTDVS